MEKPKWVLIGDTEDSRRLASKLEGRSEIITWKDVHTRDKIEADIIYGSLVGVNDVTRRFNIIGSWLDYPPLRCQVYYSYWGANLFNKNYRILPLGEISRLVNDEFQNTLPERFFLRPDSNNKCFTGMIADKEEIRILMKSLDPTTLCVTAPVRDMELYKEYRCFMRNGKFVTGSSYTLQEDGRVETENADHLLDLIAYAESFKPYPDLPELYALDIVKADWGIRHSLLELTCWSCAGLYASDLDKYIEATEQEWEIKAAEFDWEVRKEYYRVRYLMDTSYMRSPTYRALD